MIKSRKTHALRIILHKYFSVIKIRILSYFFTFICLPLGFSVLAAGCAEENNPLVTSDKNIQLEETTSTEVNHCGILIWKHEGLAIEAKGEKIISAETGFLNAYSRYCKMLIMFDGWATPDTPCYISTVIVRSNNFHVYLAIGEQFINKHHEVMIESTGGELITFYIVL